MNFLFNLFFIESKLVFFSESVHSRKKIKKEKHGFHMPSPSPWPYLTSVYTGVFLQNIMLIFYSMGGGWMWNLSVLFAFVFPMGMWMSDLVLESTFLGYHTTLVQSNLSLGFKLFILSEAMFFFSFFWAYFYYALSPSIWMGCTWPPVKLICVYPFGVPLFGTVVLISSGFGVTLAHSAIVAANSEYVFYGLIQSIGLGMIFTLSQAYEFVTCNFSINDSVFGSIFFVTTGFHGLHVMLGTIGLMICLARHRAYHLWSNHHVGLECAIWYWHFVDAIWLFLYLFYYIWPYFKS